MFSIFNSSFIKAAVTKLYKQTKKQTIKTKASISFGVDLSVLLAEKIKWVLPHYVTKGTILTRRAKRLL